MKRQLVVAAFTSNDGRCCLLRCQDRSEARCDQCDRFNTMLEPDPQSMTGHRWMYMRCAQCLAAERLANERRGEVKP